MKQLRYLDAVAREGHVGRAAARCSVSQPALSMQIQELEKTLGVLLLERLPKGVRLTEAGRQAADRARSVLLGVEDLVAAARAQAEGLGASLRFGVIPTIAPYILPRTLQLWRDSYPDLRAEIRETQTAALVGELLAGELDLALVALPIEHPELECAPLFEDRFFLAEPAETPLTSASPAPKRAAALKGLRLLLLEEGHCLRDQTLAVWPVEQGCKVSRYGASSLSTLVQMVAGGMGATLIPEMSVPVEAIGRTVRLRRFTSPEPRRRIGLIWRKSSPRRKTYQAVADILKQAWNSSK